MNSQEKPKLFLLDAYALIYRAFFAFGNRPRMSSNGTNTSAIYGFVNTLLDVMKNEKPTHLAVAFDSPGPTFRHDAFPAYKAQREETPEGIKIAIPYIKKILAAFDVPVIALKGYEADDIIGTLATKAGKLDIDVYMMTPDKDYGQLVNENVKMYKPGRGGGPAEVLGVKEILEKWEIESVDQVIDILGLWGDSSDNIPGIPGVGEKTAKKLMKIYGSMESILEHSHELKGKLQEKVAANKEQALNSKWLATIVTDLDMEPDLDAYKIGEPKINEIKEIFEELEFRTLSKRLFGSETSSQSNQGQLDMFLAGTVPTISPGLTASKASSGEVHVSSYSKYDQEKVSYTALTNKEQVSALAQKLKKAKAFCFDTETTGLDTLTCDLLGIAISYKENEAFYIPVQTDMKTFKENASELLAVIKDERCLKIGQNLKYDLQVFEQFDIEVKGPLFDTMLAHYLLAPDQRHNMDYLSRAYLNYDPISITELIGKRGKNQGNMKDVPLEKVIPYACEDADITYQLYKKFSKELEATEILNRLFWDVEMPLMLVLSEMELSGVALESDSLKEYSIRLGSEIQNLEKSIIKEAGVNFNIASPKQLGEVLFDILKLDDKAKKTKTGQYKTDEEVLSRLSREHKIAKLVLEFRSLQKLKSTYVDALPEIISKKTGLIHTSFHQAVAATGRLSSQNPNLQNIPIRTEQGREVRRAFIPRKKGNLIFSADYSQVELRIMAHFSNETNMLEDFSKGIDIHASTAAKVFGIDLDKVDGEQRRKAKMVNFGIIYGISAFGLSQRLEIPRREASDLIKQYFETYPGIKEYMDECIEMAKEKGYAETILGRRRYLPDLRSPNATVRGFAERNAINAPIQGSAADIIKLAMIKISARLKAEKLKAIMTMQVHDELVFDAPEEEMETLEKLVIEEMEQAYKLKVELKVDCGKGSNWLEAH